MDCATYRLLFGQITNSCETYHYNFPSHNLLSLESLLKVSKSLSSDGPEEGNDFLASFPCYQQFPYAVRMSFPLFCGSGLTDHARKLVERKSNWEMKLKKLRISNIDNAVEKVKKLRQNKAVELSDGLKKYIKHFHNDPEPMFSGNYNWLYTGGCLSCDNNSYDTTLISADYFNKKPGFYLLKLNKTLDKVEYKSFNELKNCSPVLQIKCKDHLENFVICVRQKNYLSLFSAKRDVWDVVKLWRKKVLNSKLLTCVDLKENCDEVVLTDTNFDIHVFNVERRNKIYSYSGKKIAPDFDRSCWSQVAFGDHGIYCAFENCFAVLDLRDIYSTLKLEYNPTTVADQCEEICSFVPSLCDSNFVYLGTTHSLFQLDLRNGKTVQKWTHMMKNSPQFITSIKEAENEVLVLQSQTVGETSGIVNECIKGEEGEVSFLSRSLPCLLMSMADSVNIAHLSSVCLNPFVAKRVNFAVTGMQCLKNSEGEIVLLTKNSGGDIFLSKIRRKTSNGFDAIENQQEVVERMKIYESELENIPRQYKTNNHIEHFDMRHLLRKESRRNPAKKRPEIRWKCEEVYSPESLVEYRDLLARKILEVWGYGLEEEEDEEVMSVEHKVRDWMERC